MWRIRKDTGLVSDSQLTTLDLLEDHLSKMSPEDLKELKVDVQNFFQYWPKKCKPVGEDYVAHIFGVVGACRCEPHRFWFRLGNTLSLFLRLTVMVSHWVIREVFRPWGLVSFQTSVWWIMTAGPTAPSFWITASEWSTEDSCGWCYCLITLNIFIMYLFLSCSQTALDATFHSDRR